jgi:acyl carrier protein
MSEIATNAIPESARADTVRACIAEALMMDVDGVALTSNLMDELGADSLAFLDIVFKLEQAFDIEITRGEMERAARGDMTEEEFAPDGVISEAGLVRLRELLPEAKGRIQPGLRPGAILGLFTVHTFLKIVEGKLRGERA